MKQVPKPSKSTKFQAKGHKLCTRLEDSGKYMLDGENGSDRN